jgi:hypothetical protein
MRTIAMLTCILFILCCKNKPQPASAPTTEKQPLELGEMKLPPNVSIEHGSGPQCCMGYSFPYINSIDDKTYYYDLSYGNFGSDATSPHQLIIDSDNSEVFAFTKDPARTIRVNFGTLPIHVLNAKSVYARWIEGQDFVIVNNYDVPAKLAYYGDTITLGKNTSHYLYSNFKSRSLRDTAYLRTDTAFISGYFIRKDIDDTVLIQDLAMMYHNDVQFIKKPLGVSSCHIAVKDYQRIDSLLPYISNKLGCRIERKDLVLFVY